MANVQNLKPWKKGQSGNPAGRPPLIKYVTDHVRDVLLEQDEETGKSNARLVAETIVAEAKAGTPALVLSLLDRTEGKVTDKLDVTSAGKSLADLLIALKQPNGSSD